MPKMTRRSMLSQCTVAGSALLGLTASGRAVAVAEHPIQFTMDLRCGSIGVRANQTTAIDLACRHGFQSVTPEPSYLARLSNEQAAEFVAELKEKNLRWGAAGLPVEFRRDDDAFRSSLQELPRLAHAMQRVGATRVGTWLSPGHNELTYVANFRQHATRLRECAKILGDHGQRLGLEYVGPKTSWTSRRFCFIHTMAETKDLIAEIGLDNVGFVLDGWHWYTAHEEASDLRTLNNHDIVACDLNDAPAGVPIDQQIDNRRELPGATGVIDLKTFLGVLVDIGYDGPVRAEPFNRRLT